MNNSYELLEKLNYIRIPFIVDSLKKNMTISSVKNLKILDVGCGVGILSEPLSRLGMMVTAVDQDHEYIEKASRTITDVDYVCADLSLYQSDELFDCIVVSEVIEHILNQEDVLLRLSTYLKDGGIMIISTINRTWQAYVGAIFFAENILRLVPKKTHAWSGFMKPSELDCFLSKNNFEISELQGVFYDVFKNKWSICASLAVNYIVSFLKKEKI